MYQLLLPLHVGGEPALYVVLEPEGPPLLPLAGDVLDALDEVPQC